MDPLVSIHAAWAGAPAHAMESAAPAGRTVAPASAAQSETVKKKPASKKTRKRLGPLPDGYTGRLGCPKCVHHETGCRRCRTLAGLFEDEAGVWHDDGMFDVIG